MDANMHRYIINSFFVGGNSPLLFLPSKPFPVLLIILFCIKEVFFFMCVCVFLETVI